MKLSLKNIKIHPALAFVSGVFVTVIFTHFINTYLDRPKIEGTIDCLNIYKNEENDFVLNIYAQFENSGKTGTTINLRDFKLQFKGINEKPYYFDLKRNLKIDGLSLVDDTIKIKLPKELDTLTSVPRLSMADLNYSEINNKKFHSIEKDSTNEYWSFMQGVVIPENPDSFSYHPDYIVNNGQAKIIGKKIPIEYKHKIYTCFIYPKEALVSYKVENDKIHIKYGIETNVPISSDGQIGFLSKPIIFIPAPEIEDKCIIPNGYEFSMMRKFEENGMIRVKNYSVSFKNYSKQIVYFLK